MEKFIRELRAAKKRGVDVDEVFAGERERLMLFRIKMFGVGFSIVWSLGAPIFVLVLKYHCIANKLPHEWIPVDITYWLSGVSLLSMIAFAYNLVDINDFLPRLPLGNKPSGQIQNQRETLQLMTVDDYGAEGDV